MKYGNSYLFSKCLRYALLGLTASALGAEIPQAPTVAAVNKRPPKLGDLYSKQIMPGSHVIIAPDGEAIAFGMERSKLDLPPAMRTAFVHGWMREDLWVYPGKGSPAINVTNGEKDDTGFAEKQWSPDSRRLAFVCNRGRRIGLWVWDRATQSSRKVTDQEVVVYDAIKWLDNERILVVVPAEGERARMGGFKDFVSDATHAWDQAMSGAVTASVVESLAYRRGNRRLLLVNVATGAGKIVANLEERRLDSSSAWLVSPDGSSVVSTPPQATRYPLMAMETLGWPVALEITRLDGKPLALRDKLPGNILASTLSWSPDGKELAFFAYGDAPINPRMLYGNAAAEVMVDASHDTENHARLWRLSLESGRLHPVETTDIDMPFLGAPRPQWTAIGELLFRAAPRDVKFRTNDSARTSGRGARANGAKSKDRWILIGRDGSSRPLLREETDSPSHLHSVEGGRSLVGLVAEYVVRIDSAAGTLQRINAQPIAGLTGLEIPGSAQGKAGCNFSVLLSAQDKKRYTLRLDTGEWHELNLPRVHKFVGFDDATATCAYITDSNDGTRLSVQKGDGKGHVVMHINQHQGQAQRAERRVIDYTSQQGHRLKGLLIMPTNYKPGRKYPVIVNAYPMANPEAHTWITSVTEDDNDVASGGDIYAASGYAYFIPEIPYNIPGFKDEEGLSMAATSAAILPAVDKLVAEGIADPDRLFIDGGSLGGWATLATITQTNRFKAASVRNGIYAEGFRSNVGATGYSYLARYGDGGNRFAAPTGINRGYFPSDVPWWRDRDRSRRNSPMEYVERVRTPVMIMHSDLDTACDITEAEQLFNALSSMRKPVQFVRYWGEGHGNYNPANRKDFLQRMFAWFDLHGDILRDGDGNIIFEGDRVVGRGGAPAPKPEDYAQLPQLQLY